MSAFALLAKTFRSLGRRNYRLYFFGQLVSQSGTWMQTVAQDWLVLKLTGRAMPVGITVALQFLPFLLFGLWSGSLADRFDKRRLLLATQAVMACLALTLGLLEATGTARLWMVYVLAFLLGSANALDVPARQSFMGEIVETEELPNAVALNSAAFNTARTIGPMLAGLVVAAWGVATAFYLNALSFVAVIVALIAMDGGAIRRSRRKAGGGAREGIAYVFGNPELRAILLLMSLLAIFGINFRAVFPILARFAFGGGPDAYGFLASAFAVGSLMGALGVAARARPTLAVMVVSALFFGIFAAFAALAPTLNLEALALVGVGVFCMSFLSSANSLLQLRCAPEMRGRALSLYSMVFFGSLPIGGALVGFLSEVAGPRSGLWLSVGSAAVTVAVGWRYILKQKKSSGVASVE